MDTKKTSADLIRDFFKKSNGIIDFSQRIFSFFEDNEDSDIWKIFEKICNFLEERKVKVITRPSPGVYEYLDGGRVEKEQIKLIDKYLDKALGLYIPNINVIFIQYDIEVFDISLVSGYGIDQHLLNENFMLAFCSVYIHEVLHAIMFNQGLPLMPDSPEIMSIKNQVSKAGRLNNLSYLKSIDENWQEIITHIVSSKKYYHWLLDNNLSFDLSKALNKVFVDEILRQDVIDLINGWTKKFYSEPTDIVYFIPDYAKSENFMSREFFANYPKKILGSEISTTNRWGKPIYKTKRIESDHSIDDILGRVENIPGLDWESFDNYKKIDHETSSDIIDINKSIDESIERKKKQKENGEVEAEVTADLISFTESVNLYNVVPGYLTWIEIEAYIFCYPGENKLLWREKFEYTEEQILASESTITLNKQMDNECTITIPTVIFTGEVNEFFSLFLHGDVFSKTQAIRSYREEIIVKRGEEYYNKLIESLEGIKFISVTFDNEDYNKRPYISPVSETSKEFQITKFIGSENRYRTDEAFSLLEAFLYVVGDREGVWFKSSRYAGVIPADIEKALKGGQKEHRFVPLPFSRGKDLTAGEKAANDEADNRNVTKFDFVFGQTCICFSDFIRECLEESDRKKLEEEISGFYNKFCFTDLEKIPVGFTHSSRFKRGKLHLKGLQRNSIAFVNINKTGLLAHEVGTGKAQLLTTDILTPSGYVKMGDISVGDLVIGKNGKPTKVIGVFPQGIRQCYKITFSDGSSTEVSDEHLWNVQTINYRGKYPWKWDTVMTKDIIDNLYNYRGNYQYSIPMVNPVYFNEQNLPIDPYLLGILLGDGGLSQNSVTLTNPEIDILEKIIKILPDGVSLKALKNDNLHWSIRRTVDIGLNEILNKLKNLNLMGCKANNKFIPEIYKINSPENRIELLRGLLDSDGYIDKGRNGKKGCSVIYTTVSKRLKDDVIFLVQSFGGTCIVKEKIPHYTHNEKYLTGQLAYNISIRLPSGIIPVSSKKQISKFIEKSKYQPIRFIQNIEDIGMHEAQCIKVDAQDELYICNDFIVTHNSLSTLATVSYYFDTNRANKALIVVPPTIYEKWINECANHTEKIINPDTNEEEEIELYGGFPHLNVVGLSNLSDKVLLGLKEYSSDEKKKIAAVDEGAKLFNAKIKKSIKGIEIEETEEVPDNDEISDASVDEDKPKKKEKLSISLPAGYANAQAFVNNMLKDVNIEALAGFGITNEENKNYSAIYSVLNNHYNNNTLSYTFKKYYTEAGEKLEKIWSFDSIHENVHASVILSYIYDTYSMLKSHLIATLGTFKEFPSKTIFFTTYVGLARFGFKNDTITLMAKRLLEILKGSDLEGESKAKIEKNIESLLERSDIEAKVFFEDFGFDYIAIDEAHRLKNLITTITTKEEEERELYVGNKSQIKTIKGGSQSKIALTGFMATMYIQMHNGGRNTLLLTATPFTNSPLEIYSMLTLTNYNYLTNLGYPDVLKFAQDFFRIKAQLSISVEGTVKTKIEPVGYTNLSLLRRIIYTLIDFRSAEESDIMRPCKIVLPIKEKSTLCDSPNSPGFVVIKPISTIVIPSREQQLVFDALQVYLSSQINKRTVDQVFMDYIARQGGEYIKKVTFSDQGMEYSDYMTSVYTLASHIKDTFNVDKEGKKIEKLFSSVAILKTLMAMRNVSISPYMFRPYVNSYLGIADADIDPNQVIMQSPKLLYMLSCIKKANNIQRQLGKDLKGFVIYSNLGTKPGKNSPISLLKILKQYLLDESNDFGYKTGIHEYEDLRKKFDDVEILADKSASNAKQRNAIMNLFNRGQIKVIITTVKEGVDLNGDTITLFNISVDWNPTDAKQIEGRAWRQGNKNAYIIISYPLTANSSDMAIYQKLQDKTARLKALWDKTSNLKSAFDLDEFNPEQIKMEMISSVSKLAPFIYNEETTVKRYEYEMLKSKRDEDGAVINNFKIFQEQELKLRYAMTLFTKLPKILDKANKWDKLVNDKHQSENAINLIRQSIDEAKRYLPEYEALNKINKEIVDLENALRIKAGEIGTAMAMDENEKVPVIKKEIEAIKTQIADKKKEAEKSEKAMEKALSESIKESQGELEKEEKELKKIQKAMDVLYEEKPFDEPDVPMEFEFIDQNKGNYFVKSEAGTGIVYKTFDKFKLSLDKIDWIRKATIFDLFEGVTRIIEMYTNINSQFSVAFSDYKEEQLDLTYLLVNNYNVLPQEAITDLANYMRAYDGTVYKSRLLALAKDFQSSYDRQYWNIYWVAQLKMSVLRSLRDYKAIVEDKDPDVYLQEFDEKLEQLYQEIGASENMSDIPDNVLEKYINQAYEIISKRRLEFENYTSLVDGYASFSDLFNIELESVFVNKNLVKELADEASISIKGEVIDQKEGTAIIILYQDKIDVYKEMIEEATGDEKQMYIDKIEVYEEMINDLKSK
ncbi:MAG: LAGLIDADG family homing endonuclease [Candidatus Nanoarchaeia archaeon]|nr:LAGLIDADG family homing endonuclease [Candidatus Nanoarchaeia archaeon]